MEIKVLGAGCANCKRLEALTREAVTELGVQATIDKVTDYKDIASYGVLGTPGLVIDGQVKVAGRVPNKNEIAAWIAAAR